MGRNLSCVCCGLSICSLLLGVVLLVLGIVGPGFMSAEIKERLHDELKVTDVNKFNDRSSDSDSVTTYFLYNLTNLAQVVTGTAKPRFETVPVKIRFVGKRYNAKLGDEGRTVTYKTWSKYSVVPEFEELYNNGTIININPQFLLIYTKAGSEANLFIGAANVVVGQMATIFLETLPATFQFLAVPSYLSTLLSLYTGVNRSAETLQLHWGGISRPEVPQSIGFEIKQQSNAAALLSTSALHENQIAYLWNASEPFALLSESGIMAWMELCSCPQLANMSTMDQCFISAPRVAIAAALEVAEGINARLTAAIVCAYVVQLSSSDAYFGLIKLGMGSAASEATNWGDLGALQFGASALSQGMFNVKSLQQAGMLPLAAAPELMAAADALNMSDVLRSLTIAESRAFLANFSVSANVQRLAIAVRSSTLGDSSRLAQLVDCSAAENLCATGLTSQNAIFYFQYLTRYLPKRIFYPAFVHGGTSVSDQIAWLNGVGPDSGIMPSGSGLFTRRTVKEIMEGWVDPVVAVFDENFTHYGVLGKKQGDSPEAYEQMDDYNATENTYTRMTGNDDVKLVMNHAMYQGMTKFKTRDHLPGQSCDDDYTRIVKNGDCNVWATETETSIIGAPDGILQEPFTGDLTWENVRNVQGPSKRDVFSFTFMRTIPFQRRGQVDVKGIPTDHYTIADQFYQDAATNVQNSAYHMTIGDNLWPIETTKEGAPMIISPPYFIGPTGSNEAARSCFNFEAFPTTYNEEKNGYWMRVNPVTGIAVNGRGSLQNNFMVNKGILNSGFWENIWTSTNCTVNHWPYFIGMSEAVINDPDTILFLYDMFDLASLSLWVGIIAGSIFVFLSLCCFGFRWWISHKSGPAMAEAHVSPNVASGTVTAEDTPPAAVDVESNRVAPAPAQTSCSSSAPGVTLISL